MAAWGSGLYRFQKETNHITRYDLGELGNNFQCFEETYPGVFWLGCNGFFEFNSLTGEFRDPFPAGIADILNGHTFTGFLRDQNQVYFASYTGIYVYDMLKKRLFQFEYPQNDSLTLLSAFQIFSPIKLKNGEIIAISGSHGINKINFDAQTGNYISYHAGCRFSFPTQEH